LLLLTTKNRPIGKQFNMGSIARYILLGKGGNVITANAPRLSGTKIRELFDELLKK